MSVVSWLAPVPEPLAPQCAGELIRTQRFYVDLLLTGVYISHRSERVGSAWPAERIVDGSLDGPQFNTTTINALGVSVVSRRSHTQFCD